MFERLMTLYASTLLHRPGIAWEWRISRDVADEVVARYAAHPATTNQMRALFGWPVKVMDDATPGTIGLVA